MNKPEVFVPILLDVDLIPLNNLEEVIGVLGLQQALLDHFRDEGGLLREDDARGLAGGDLADILGVHAVQEGPRIRHLTRAMFRMRK